MSSPSDLPEDLAALMEEDAAIVTEPDAATRETLDRLVSEMIDYKNNLDELEALKKAVNAKYDDIRMRRLPELMRSMDMITAAGKGGFTHSSGASISLRRELYVYYKKEYQQDVFQWMRDNGHAGLITEVIQASTLKAWVKEQDQDGNAIPPQITVTPHTVAIMKRPKESTPE